MHKLLIEGKHPLNGTVEISGAKNAALPILFSTILTTKPCEFENVPNLLDIHTTNKLLAELGIDVQADLENHKVCIQAAKLTNRKASYDLVRTMRASVLVMGPLLARYGEAEVSLPGGCSIGARPVNYHLQAFEKMGAKITLEGGYIHAKAEKLHGAEVTFDQVSVGATENAMMAASLAQGTTVLRNSAQEPEIVDLARFLKTMGAKITGEGTPVITIEGVAELIGGKHRILPDRIEAGTYLIAGAITGGSVFLPKVPGEILGAVLEKLKDAGLSVQTTESGVELKSNGIPKAVNISTLPFPGFPTDMQAQFMALSTVSEGTSVITENIFENRFMHVAELLRLGADISVQGKAAVVKGKGGIGKTAGLKGATVMATDLRASACLVLAGLASEGTTTVRRVYHLDRGYEQMEVKLKKLGAKIRREKE